MISLKCKLWYFIKSKIRGKQMKFVSKIAGPLPPAEQLDSLQATCRQFARFIDFALSFDAIKMFTPALQNDFSFYRRAMSREVRHMC